MTRSLILLAIISVSFSAATLVADAIVTDSDRFVVVMNQGGPVVDGPYQEVCPTVEGAFDEYIESHAWDLTHGGSSQANQNSNITNGVYSAEMAVRTDAGGGTMGADIATGYAESVFEVYFTLTEQTDFNVSGTYNAFGQINGMITETEIRIESLGGGSPGQLIAFANDDCCPSVNVDGTLLPGDYALKAYTLAIADHSFMMSYVDGNAETNFTMTLDIPTPSLLGDLNCSGAVDLDDVGPFVQALLDPDAYDAAFPTCDKNLADMNSDAQRNGSDVAIFVQCLLSNCP